MKAAVLKTAGCKKLVFPNMLVSLAITMPLLSVFIAAVIVPDIISIIFKKREYRGERNFRRHRNYDRKNYQGGNNERGEQKRGDNPQS